MTVSIAAQPLDDDFAEVDRVLCHAAGVALPLIHLEPSNASAERDRVAIEPGYDPQFCYPPVEGDELPPMLARLESLSIPEHGVGIFFGNARDYLCGRLRLRLRLGQDQHWQGLLYGPPPDRVITLARRILSAPRPRPRSVDQPFAAEDLSRLIRARLRQYRLDDWDVIIRPNISATNTDSANRLLNIRADARYTMEDMKRLVVHEVDTHVLRAANGYCQPYRIFAVGAVPSYLMTEEGLAVVNEERMGYIDAARSRTFAGRVLAAVSAATSSFHEVYAEQRSFGFTHEEAFVTSKRVKRGLSDTRHPGGYIKDHVYLWGRLLVEEYVLSGGDLSRLYVGKVALEHVPLIQELGLRPARRIPYPYR